MDITEHSIIHIMHKKRILNIDKQQHTCWFPEKSKHIACCFKGKVS